MFSPDLMQILTSTFTYGACGCLASVAVFLFNRGKAGVRLDQAAAIGFLIGAAFGAFFGIFQTMMNRA